MKSLSIINTTSNEGLDIQNIVRHGLISMALAIIFLSGAVLWTVFQLTDFYKNEVHITTEQEDLLNTMRLAAKERTLLLYAMTIEEDPFEMDDQRMAFYSAGATFSQARINFINTPLSDDELDLLEMQGRATGFARPAQEQVLGLLIKEQGKAALNVLRTKAIPGQNEVMQILDQLNISIDKRYYEVKTKSESIGKVSIIILVAIVITIIFGVLYIIRQTTFRISKLISQLIDTRKSLEKTNNELIYQKDTLDHHAIVSIADKKGNIVYVNEKFCEVSGYTRDELIGKNHRLLKSDSHSAEFYQNLWDTISQGKIWQGEICNRRKDGSFYWIESTISPFLDSTGKPYQYVSIRTDITHLLEAKLEAEKANLAKSSFLSSMSHELRTPMNAILGFSQILEMSLDGKQLESVKEISAAGNHLMTIINEIMDLARIEIGGLELSLEEVDFEALIKECFKLVENMALNKNIKTQFQILIPPEVRVIANRIRLKQALLNYLSNAIKFNCMNGEVMVCIKPVDSDKCRILVKDSGPGLNEDQRSIVFNPFTKLDEHNNIVEGSGIGLTVTKRLIEMMNGKVGVESEVDDGSVFWMELPTVNIE